VNWVPLSHTNFRGTPTRPSMRSRNAFCTKAVVAFRIGTNSTHLENASWKTRSMEFPCFERGSGRTKSAQRMSKASLMSKCCFGLNGLKFLARLAVPQWFASRYMPGQKYLCDRRLIVFRTPSVLRSGNHDTRIRRGLCGAWVHRVVGSVTHVPV